MHEDDLLAFVHSLGRGERREPDLPLLLLGAAPEAALGGGAGRQQGPLAEEARFG